MNEMTDKELAEQLRYEASYQLHRMNRAPVAQILDIAAARLEARGEISEAMVERAAEAEFYFEFPSARVDPAYWEAELVSEAGKIRLARAGAALEAAQGETEAQ